MSSRFAQVKILKIAVAGGRPFCAKNKRRRQTISRAKQAGLDALRWPQTRTTPPYSPDLAPISRVDSGTCLGMRGRWCAGALPCEVSRRLALPSARYQWAVPGQKTWSRLNGRGAALAGTAPRVVGAGRPQRVGATANAVCRLAALVDYLKVPRFRRCRTRNGPFGRGLTCGQIGTGAIGAASGNV